MPIVLPEARQGRPVLKAAPVNVLPPLADRITCIVAGGSVSGPG
jgi:hypothetical protein